MFNFLIFILFISFSISQLDSDMEIPISMPCFLIENPSLYKNEICSYHGSPIIDDSGSVICECFSSYVNEPKKNKNKYIGDQMVQCSYRKKKRFKAFFLAGILPIGFDYYYLGHIFYFCLIFIAFIVVLINNFVNFYLFYRLDKSSNEDNNNKKNENNEENDRDDNPWHRSNKNNNQKDKYKKCLNIYNIINKICLILFAIYWVIDVILQLKGIVKDSNGVETDNDLSILFARVEA